MRTNRNTNIFRRVADSEVPFTELFCNFMDYKIFREVVFSVISDSFDFSTVEYEHISTQFRLPNQCGQPDVVIENEDILVLIEIKINNSYLTKNQPENYYLHLTKSDKDNLLVFVIPENYAHREELERRAANIPHNIFKVITWSEILNKFSSMEIDNINLLFNEFFDLLSSWYAPHLEKFNSAEVSYMFTSAIPSILTKLFSIVDSVKEATSPTCSARKLKNGEYGISYENDSGEEIFYFGVWYEFWEKHKKPLVFGVHNNFPQNIKDDFLKRKEGKLIPLDDWHMTWLEQEDLEDSGKIIEVIQYELDRLLALK